MPSSTAQYRARARHRAAEEDAAKLRDLAAYQDHHRAVYAGTIRDQHAQALKAERDGIAAQLRERHDLPALKRARLQAEHDAITAELARQGAQGAR